MAGSRRADTWRRAAPPAAICGPGLRAAGFLPYRGTESPDGYVAISATRRHRRLAPSTTTHSGPPARDRPPRGTRPGRGRARRRGRSTGRPGDRARTDLGRWPTPPARPGPSGTTGRGRAGGLAPVDVDVDRRCVREHRRAGRRDRGTTGGRGRQPQRTVHEDVGTRPDDRRPPPGKLTASVRTSRSRWVLSPSRCPQGGQRAGRQPSSWLPEQRSAVQPPRWFVRGGAGAAGQPILARGTPAAP